MTKEDLKGYYRNLKEIKRLQTKVENLKMQRQKIIDNINNDNVSLNADIQAISYNNAVASSGLCISQQEKAIDKAYEILDYKQRELYFEIVGTEVLIGNLELINTNVEYFLQTLNYEDLKLFELYFKEHKTSLQISFDLNMNVSTVYRRINKLLKEYSGIYEL